MLSGVSSPKSTLIFPKTIMDSIEAVFITLLVLEREWLVCIRETGLVSYTPFAFEA